MSDKIYARINNHPGPGSSSDCTTPASEEGDSCSERVISGLMISVSEGSGGPCQTMPSGSRVRSPSKLGSPRSPRSPRSTRGSITSQGSESPAEEVASSLRAKLVTLECAAEDTEYMTVVATSPPSLLTKRRDSGSNNFSPLLIQATPSASFTPTETDIHDARTLLRARLTNQQRSPAMAASEQADLPDRRKSNVGLAGVLYMMLQGHPVEEMGRRKTHRATRSSPLIKDADLKIDSRMLDLQTGDSFRRHSDPNISFVSAGTASHPPELPPRQLSPPRGNATRLTNTLALMKTLKKDANPS